MVLIISIVAFLAVTFLFVLDTAKDQTTTSEVSTYLSPFESETFIRHNYSASIETVWQAVSNLSSYNYWFTGVARILPVVDTDRYVHRYSFDQYNFAPGSLLSIKNRGPYPSGKGMIASAIPNKKLEMVLQYNPFHKEYVTFDLQSHSEGTSLSLTRKSTGPFSFLSVWGFDSKKSKILDNLGYLIPEADLSTNESSDKKADISDTSDNLFEDRNLMAAYLVNKTLDGDSSIIKSTKDVYVRGKAKALLIKINKGTAERPAMPEAGEAPTVKNTSDKSNTTEVSISLSKDDIIATVVNQALDGDDGPLNELTDKVLRAKSKSIIMKINKVTAQSPPIQEANNTLEHSNALPVASESDTTTNVSSNEESEDSLIERLIADGVKGNMEEINALENKVLRGKIKAAIVKAKRSK